METSRIATYTMGMEERAELLRQVERLLFSRKEILFAYAHGSFLREKHFRDLDIGVFLDREHFKGVRYNYEIQLEEELKRLLEVEFPVDVRPLNSASIPFQYKAIRGRLLLDRSPDVRVSFCTRVTSRYLDMRPVLRYHTKEAFSYET
ncbi:MAG: nucleotidyltransferase domain-containing protein [Deltaproteobacteria bacterium]|nr:nucleotidyltransferase domain-containing protein [Deltaproteobacteria bacterium]